MKSWSLLLMLLLSGWHLSAEEERPIVYPFDVKVAGQLAVANESNPDLTIFAKIKDPVSADAEVEVSGTGDMILINIFPVLETGEVPAEAANQTKVIMKQSGKTMSLSETMDNSSLSPGLYGMNIGYGGKTSRVMFRVK